MTYAGFETSTESGQPLELFLFELSGAEFPFNNGESEETFNATIYKPEAIKRGSIANEADKSSQQVNITVPVTNEFAQLYLGVPPGERSSVEIFQRHRTDTPGLETVSIFQGLVSTVTFAKDGKEAVIVCRPLSSTGERATPRRTFQGLCNHVLFDDRCTLNEVDFEETGTVTVVSGRNVTITGLTNVGGGSDYWENGYVEFANERRLINLQTANVFKLNIEFKNTPVGSTVRVLPGCKLRRIVDCDTKFSNVLSFGGFSWVPTKNPFESGID